MTRIYLTKNFVRWAGSEGLTDDVLKKAVAEMDDGLIDANLGGLIYKKRVGVHGQGKRSGLRTIVGFKSGDTAFFVYGFSKNQQDNISTKEKAAFKEMAKELFKLTDTQLQLATKSRALKQIF